MKKKAEMIGLVAPRPGSGKDTFFEGLKETLKGPVLRNVKFADALSQEVYDLFMGSPLEDLKWVRNDATAKDHPFHFLAFNRITKESPYKTPADAYVNWAESHGFDLEAPRSMREHLIEYGTNFRRKYEKKDSYWLLKGLKAARMAHETGSCPVITDVRFPNEAEHIKRIGGILVYIQPDWTPKESGGIADGLIDPETCHITVNNFKANRLNMVKEFLNEYEIPTV